MVQTFLDKVLSGQLLGKEEALCLMDCDLAALCGAADQIRRHFCGNHFDICTIINGKSGRCSENCKYCAQSIHYPCHIEEYPLLDRERILTEAVYHGDKGILRYSVVTSGVRLSDAEVDTMCGNYRAIGKSCDISLCASHGLLNEQQLRKLKQAGVTRYHNNLETSRRFFPHVCTTHTYDDKRNTLLAAKKTGLSICSGGIMGLGETMEDRIDMALDLRTLEVKSVPINILNPIPGTPFAKNTPLKEDEICRIVAIYRFLLPDAALRLAGGRGLLPDKGRRIFRSGANAAISGDMLTTSGISIQEDYQLLAELAMEVCAL